jgi:hypothetical protein
LRLRRDTRGAVVIEFLIAFFPVMLFFLALWQLSIIFYAKLILDHAANVTARAAAVIIAEQGSCVGENDDSNVGKLTSDSERYKRIERAALLAMAPIIINGTFGTGDVAGVPAESPTLHGFSIQAPNAFKLEFPAGDTPGGPDQLANNGTASYSAMQPASLVNVRVRISGIGVCKIAFANLIACPTILSEAVRRGVAGASLLRFLPPYVNMTSEAVFPYQGASYAYTGSSCGK